MRIAHFIQRYPPARGGSEAYFERLSRYLVEHGDQVTVFTSNAIDLDAFWSRRGQTTPPGITREHGVEVRRHGLWRWPGRRYLLKSLSFIPQRCWQCLTMPCNPISPSLWRDSGRAEGNFDAVHASAFPYAWPLVCARRLARKLRVPFLLTPFLHLGDPDDPDDPIRRAYTAPPLRWLLNEADVVFAQTLSEHRQILDLGLAPNRVILQGLGVDPAECTGGDREQIRREWGVGPGEVVVGHLANQSREKGTVDLLLAAKSLWQRGVALKVVLAGSSMPNFQTFWKTLASPEHVRQLGSLTDQARRDFFAGLDLFVLPSRSDSFGLVLLEAWANGIPNVAYRAGGIADLIRHQTDGWLAPCGNIELLAQGMERLIRDAALRQSLGQAGRERIPSQFRWQDKLAMVRAAACGEEITRVNR